MGERGKAEHPWRHGLFVGPRRQRALTATEVGALREAHATGRFTLRSLARIYDVSQTAVRNALRENYQPRKDS